MTDHPLDPNTAPAGGSLLDHYAALTAAATQAPFAAVAVMGRTGGKLRHTLTFGSSTPVPGIHAAFSGLLGRFESFTQTTNPERDGWPQPAGLLPEPAKYMACLPLLSPGDEHIGFVLLAAAEQRDGLQPLQRTMLEQVAALALADRKREMRHAHLLHIHERARRVDRLLRLVSDAPSCASGLSSVLEDLCRHYGAAIGTISQLAGSDEVLTDVSLWAENPRLQSFFSDSNRPEVPMDAEHSWTAGAIRNNQPHAVTYSDVGEAGLRPLARYGMAHGLVCQVAVPIWVGQQNRFGIWLAFTSKRSDLDLVMADIASLADTIRPALFRKVAEERIRFVAHHDELTQLANRLVFQEELDNALRRAGRDSSRFALLYLDLDGFKLVNDTCGHDAGDKLLAAFACRLRDSVREDDVVARIGGDEFAIIQRRGEQPAAAAALARRLMDAARQPFDVEGRRATVGASIGIAICPDDGTTPDALRRSADAALYRAKEAGRNTYEIASQPRRQMGSPLTTHDLGEALSQGQFTLLYQPICDSRSLRVEGLEALLRWRHPTRGLIDPLDFIPLAEQSGQICGIGEWVLEAACYEAATWDPNVRLAVNLSPGQFRDPGLSASVAAVLTRTGLQASRLDLEVTEGLSLDASSHVLQTMQELKALGAQLSVDDFGTAYAGLAYLQRFPFDRLKIDKLFIHGMGTDAGAFAIVQSIVSLGAKLQLVVIAEGVETQADLQAARDVGCALVQGFFLGRPVAPSEARVLATGRLVAPALRARSR